MYFEIMYIDRKENKILLEWTLQIAPPSGTMALSCISPFFYKTK